MNKYLIGLPGHPARFGLEAAVDADLSHLLMEGEVIVVVEAFENGKISDDGLSFIPTGIDMELEQVMVRSIRTGLLSACDWTQVPDAPLSPEQKAAWLAYRQALRDLPTEQPNATRDTVVWPQEPS